MEPLRLLLGLVFAVMSVGVLVFPVSWPFSQGETAAEPSLDQDETAGNTTTLAEVNLEQIPTDTVLSLQTLPPSKDLADQLSLAKYLAAEKDFDEALDVLSKLSVIDQDRYEVVFLRARILSWSGRYQAAEQKFQRLMHKYPEDTDLMVSYGYLQFYQGKSAEAEKAFMGVLKINPDYSDAQDGLAKARKAL